ncbi:MAG: PilZ domain-containing protein [candidate division FCPU426 bacterium]
MSVFRLANRAFTDRRRHPRYPVKVKLHYLSLKLRDHGHLQEGYTHDLALGGLAMKGHHALEAGQQLMINLFLPALPSAGAQQPDKETVRKTIQAFILSKVVWQKQEAGHFLSGVQFMELTTYDRKRLKDFLADIKPSAS